MKKLAVFFLFFLLLFSACGEKPVTQVYLPVESEDKLDSAAASENSSSEIVSDSASRETNTSIASSNKTSSKNSSSSELSSKVTSESAVSSTDSSKSEEEAREALLKEKKKEKELLELIYKRTEYILSSEISEVNDKIIEYETELNESNSKLKQLKNTLQDLLLWTAASPEELNQKIAEEKERNDLLTKELGDLRLEKETLEDELNAAEREYQDAIFIISTEILALS